MVATQIYDADDRPEPRQHVGYRHLRTETVRWMKCADQTIRRNRCAMRGVHGRCLQPQNAYPAFWRRSRLSPKVQRNNFLLLSSPLTTALGTERLCRPVAKCFRCWRSTGRACGGAGPSQFDPFRTSARADESRPRRAPPSRRRLPLTAPSRLPLGRCASAAPYHRVRRAHLHAYALSAGGIDCWSGAGPSSKYNKEAARNWPLERRLPTAHV